eukprot:1099210-Pyramimonas_sp.AAC.1
MVEPAVRVDCLLLVAAPPRYDDEAPCAAALLQRELDRAVSEPALDNATLQVRVYDRHVAVGRASGRG